MSKEESQRREITRLRARIEQLETAIRLHRDLVHTDDTPEYEIEHAEDRMHKLIDAGEDFPHKESW